MTIDERLRGIIGELIDSGVTLHQAEGAFIQKYIGVALEKTHGNITGASKKLGVHRNTLHYKLRLSGIETREAARRRIQKTRKRGGRA